MSAETRATLAAMRRRYARAFDVPLEDVETEEWPDDDGRVYAPKHPDLPAWKVK